MGSIGFQQVLAGSPLDVHRKGEKCLPVEQGPGSCPGAGPGRVGAGIRGLIWIVVWLGKVAASLITLMQQTFAPHSCWSDRAVV